jgi:hypothetical protein
MGITGSELMGIDSLTPAEVARFASTWRHIHDAWFEGMLDQSMQAYEPYPFGGFADPMELVLGEAT